jgi:hypothetical protein
MDHLRGGAALGARAGAARCSPVLPRSADGGPRLPAGASFLPRHGSHRSHTHAHDHSRSRLRTAARTPGSSAHAEPPLPLNPSSSSPPAGEPWTSPQPCVTLPMLVSAVRPRGASSSQTKSSGVNRSFSLSPPLSAYRPARRASARMMLSPAPSRFNLLRVQMVADIFFGPPSVSFALLAEPQRFHGKSTAGHAGKTSDLRIFMTAALRKPPRFEKKPPRCEKKPPHRQKSALEC